MNHRLVGALLAGTAFVAGCGGNSGPSAPSGQAVARPSNTMSVHPKVSSSTTAATSVARSSHKAATQSTAPASTTPGTKAPVAKPTAGLAGSEFCKQVRVLLDREEFFYPARSDKSRSANMDRRDFIAGMSSVIARVVATAPPPIADTIKTNVADLRGQAGAGQPVKANAAEAAMSKLRQFVHTSC